jgi:hypothetical protein
MTLIEYKVFFVSIAMNHKSFSLMISLNNKLVFSFFLSLNDFYYIREVYYELINSTLRSHSYHK